MTTKYAALYIPTKPAKTKVDKKWREKLSNFFSDSWETSRKFLTGKDLDGTRIQEFKKLAMGLDRNNVTRETQEYAAAAISYIMNGVPLTNTLLLDALFNTYAPALNAGIGQIGFNSLMEMRYAIMDGNINISNFLEGFSNGLSIVYLDAEKVSYSKYGEEIPIDVLTECVINYNTQTAEHKDGDSNKDKDSKAKTNNNTEEKKDPNKHYITDYINKSDVVTIALKGNIKNENAEMWSISDISHKIVDLINDPQHITLRIGKSIYENCIITGYKPTIHNIYNIEFEMEIKYIYSLNNKSTEDEESGIRKMTSERFDYKCFTAKEVYGGIQTGTVKEETQKE